MSTDLNDTCVYIHTRTDDVVFYVGIGVPTRPYEDSRRNKHWYRTTERYAYTVSVLYSGLAWNVAAAIEIELIKKYREISGDKLCNQTDGGDGVKGLKHSDESIAKMRVAQKNKSPETRAKISAANKGKTLSPEHRAKISVAIKRRVISEETRAKIGEAVRNRSPEVRAKMTAAIRNPSPETRAKLSAVAKNMSEEHRAKIGAAHKGRTFSEESRSKMRDAAKGRGSQKKHVQKLEQLIKGNHIHQGVSPK